MARWQPNAGERLERAALELFGERGYDATAVTEIAARAGLTKSTFFRHYADKREVLFGGDDRLAEQFGAAIRQAPPDASPLACLGAALRACEATFPMDRHDLAPLRYAVIAAHPELHERQLLKRARLAAIVTEALRERGVDDTTARLAAQMGILAFSTAASRWSTVDNRRPFADIAAEVLDELRTRATELGAGTAG
ncbi:TetR/AcrR family transcriptional regulator [Mangrovihabitans endophyticus]|uniref:TetR family transcriptional regulator n=1 Tax=Mangrovihabitans endophyticus TaxID=1751298 RepID=A0A8J3C5S2_9ACTN|nr:TetR/AcrR family transcriptional regulator [Mangrovihabitans endophyticus]GGL13173.1 TetR family transcriptional regulator [Mangrovihabitans endophyticus]